MCFSLLLPLIASQTFIRVTLNPFPRIVRRVSPPSSSLGIVVPCIAFFPLSLSLLMPLSRTCKKISQVDVMSLVFIVSHHPSLPFFPYSLSLSHSSPSSIFRSFVTIWISHKNRPLTLPLAAVEVPLWLGGGKSCGSEGACECCRCVLSYRAARQRREVQTMTFISGLDGFCLAFIIHEEGHSHPQLSGKLN